MRQFDWEAYDDQRLDLGYPGTGYGATEEQAIIEFVRNLLNEADVLLGKTR